MLVGKSLTFLGLHFHCCKGIKIAAEKWTGDGGARQAFPSLSESVYPLCYCWLLKRCDTKALTYHHYPSLGFSV